MTVFKYRVITMNRFLMTRYVLICIVTSPTIFLLIFPGCRKGSSEKVSQDPVISVIRKAVKNPQWPPDVKNRATLAISQWENGVLDSEPILINACLSKPEGSDQISFSLTIFDENKDVVGFGIKEQHTDLTGKQKVVEDIYPAYVHYPLYEVANVWFVTNLQIRRDGQRKDEQQWQKYVDGPGDYTSVMGVTSYRFPPVCLSIPEPNKVDVWVWVYDKAGNRSEAVRLLNLPQNKNE